MEVIQTKLADVKILKPKVYADARGFFLESYNEEVFNQALGLNVRFIQDNHSSSSQNVLRGLHYQIENPQGKLVRVTSGKIFDVAVDLREDSDTFGSWVGMVLSAENFHMAWIPPGFAHGFYVLSEYADVLYKVTTLYDPFSERSIVWNDKELKIEWPLLANPLVSEKDAYGKTFKDAEIYESIPVV